MSTTAAPPPSTAGTDAATPKRPLAGLAELVVPAILLVIAGFLTVGTLSMVQPPSVQKPGPTFFPWIVIGVLVAMAAASTVQILAQRRRHPQAAAELPLTDDQLIDEDGQITGTPPDVPPGRAPWPRNAVSDWRAVLTVLASFVALVVLLVPVGWILSAAVLFWGVAYAFGSRRPIFDISIALVLSSAIQLIFGVALGLNLPAGFLEGVL